LEQGARLRDLRGTERGVGLHRVRDSPDLATIFSLLRNQLLLGLSGVWTVSVLSREEFPTFYALTSVDTSAPAVLLGVLAAAPLVAAGLALSRSDSRALVDINASTSQLALRLFGSQRRLVQVVFLALLLGGVTGVAEELSFRGLAVPVLAQRLALDLASPSGAAGALALSALSFGAAHWSLGGGWRDNAVTAGLQTLTGLYLGGLFLAAGGNLAVPALAHALYDAFTLLEAHVAAVAQIDYADDAARAAAARGGEDAGGEAAANELRVFFLADTTRDACLSLPEVRAALRQLGVGMEEEALRALFAEADAGGDGLLSLPEFCALAALLRGGAEGGEGTWPARLRRAPVAPSGFLW
jgi:membrane protease YdiL (CAAX protease family)